MENQEMNSPAGRTWAVLLASGKGERLGAELPKQFLEFGGRLVIEHSLDLFQALPEIEALVIVVHPQYLARLEELLGRRSRAKISAVVPGGATRQQSSDLGLRAIPDHSGRVLIHDAARPLVTSRIVQNCLAGLDRAPAVTAAIESSDTIIEIDNDGFLQALPDRSRLRRVQTPQAFDLELIRRAHALAAAENYHAASDDCGLVLRYGLGRVLAVPGEPANLKLTTREDFLLATAVLPSRSRNVE